MANALIIRCVIQFVQSVFVEIYDTIVLKIPQQMIQNVVGFFFVIVK